MLRNKVAFTICLASVVALGTGLARGQSSQDPASQNDPNQQQATKPAAGNPAKPPAPGTDPQEPKTDDKDKKAAGTSNDRLFYALPNFLTLRSKQQVPPLTVKQKYAVVARSAFDPVQLPWYGTLAAISQAENSEKGYGQGWGGYGKRFGAYAADGTIENFLVGAVLPSALHQDPRFFQSGEGGFGKRAWYSMSRILVTRSDAGKSQFNYSEIIGAAAGSAISNYSYHPKEDRTVSNTASVFASQIGYDAVTFVVKEFWPDIQRKMTKKHKASAN